MDIRLETARLLNQAGILTDEQFREVQAEAFRQLKKQDKRDARRWDEARRRFRALPWWKRLWRSESEWVRRHR